MAKIKIDGMDDILKRLARLDKLHVIKPAIKAAAAHVKGKVNVYPAASEANTPNQRQWYQRGYGPKWMTRKGKVHGKKTSETLGRKWTIEVVNGGLGAKIGNNVSYGPYVQDEDLQTSFHKARGWKTTDQVAEEETDTVLRFVRNAAEKALEKQ